MKFYLHVLLSLFQMFSFCAILYAQDIKQTGRITLEYWENVPDGSLPSLKTKSYLPHRPDGRSYIDSFSSLAGWTDTYGLRIRGYLHPPTTGEYVFTTGGGVILSLGESSAVSSAREVVSLQENNSKSVVLETGKKYYIEAVYVSGNKDHGLTVGWQLPGGTKASVIGGTYLSPFNRFVDIPEAHEVLAGLSIKHPRLLASKYDFAVLRERIRNSGQYADWYGNIKMQGEKLLGTTPPKYNYHDPYSVNLAGRGNKIIKMMETLGFIYNIEIVGGDMVLAQSCADRCWAELEAASHFDNWDTEHFAETPRMAHALGMGYDWFYNAFTPEQRAVVKKAIVELGLKKYEEELNKGPFGWHQWTIMKGNWSCAINGDTGIAILAVAGENDYLSESIFHKMLVNTENFSMLTYYPDGGTKESPSYWWYKEQFFMPLFPGMETALGTDFGMGDTKGFAETGLYPIHSMGPSGEFFNYSDGKPTWDATPGLMYLSRAFNIPLYAWTYRDRFPDAISVRSILWYDERGSKKDLLNIPLDRYFSDAEVVYLRSSWDIPDASWVGFAATDNWDFIHGQLDQGTFVFDALGERWATDFGADNYNLPGYWDKDTGGIRWKAYRIRAEGHNTLVINPGTTHEDQHPMAKGKMIDFSSTGSDPYAIADLTDAYKQNGALKVKRGVKLIDRTTLLVQDEFVLDNPSEVWWFMHTQADITVAPDGQTAMFSQNGKQMEIHMLEAPEESKFIVMSAERLPESPRPTPGERGANGYRKLAIRMVGVTDVSLAIALIPITGMAVQVPRFIPLSQWDN